MLESYDTASNGAVPATLKTDTIRIQVIEKPAHFTENLTTQAIVVGQPSQWNLPTIESGSQPILDVRIVADSRIADEISFDSRTNTITYSGGGLETHTSSQMLQLEITLVSSLGENVFFQMVTVFAPMEPLSEELDSSTKAGQTTSAEEETSSESISLETTTELEEGETTQTSPDEEDLSRNDNPLSILLGTSSVGNLHALRNQQRQELVERVIQATDEQRNRPPEVRVLRISNNREVFLTFTNEMVFPSNFTDILNHRNVVENAKGTRLLDDEVKGHDLLFF